MKENTYLIILIITVFIPCTVLSFILIKQMIKDCFRIKKMDDEYNKKIDEINRKIKAKEFYEVYAITNDYKDINAAVVYKDIECTDPSRVLKVGEEIKISGIIISPEYAEKYGCIGVVNKSIGKIYAKNEYIEMDNVKLVR